MSKSHRDIIRSSCAGFTRASVGPWVVGWVKRSATQQASAELLGLASARPSLRTGFRMLALILAGFAALFTGTSRADTFYEGKTVTLVTSTGIGGTYDLLARAISRHMPRYIPGKPTMIVQNMPGAGNVLATNYMYNVAPKDGTVMAVIHAAMPLHQVLDGRGVRYDAGKFNWLGSSGPENEIILVWSNAGIRSFEDAKKREVVVGATGEGSGLFILPMAMNRVLGTRFKMV